MTSLALVPAHRRTALVLGGGFAGLEAAIQLRRRGLDVTLVSDRPFLYVYPISIWVPTGESTFGNTCLDLAPVARRHGFALRVGPVERLVAERRAAVVGGEELSADFLVLALGGRPLGPPGVEHTLSLGGDPENGLRIKERLDALIARGRGRVAMGFGGNPKDPSAVRGGPVFEVMFNVDHLLRTRRLRDAFELTFFAPMANPGERMGARAVTAVHTMFDAKGIGKRFGTKIARFEPEGVVFADGARLDADLVVFVPAQDGHPVAKAADLPTNAAGFVRIDGGCAVEGRPGVYAVGDVAALDGPKWRAKQGHLAEVMARVAVENIAAEAAGRPARASYVPHVGITCLMDMGNGAAYVHRDEHAEKMVAMPLYGHWAKKAWGTYYKLSKRRLVPRLPGM
jgi:sulfide:quinone oxidoreductase